MMRSAVRSSNSQFLICIFHFSLLFVLYFAFGPFGLERLRKSKLNLSLVQTIDRVERSTGIQVLRNQEFRWIQKITVVYRQRAAQRSFDPKAQAHRVTPAHPQILGIYVFDKISGRRDRFGMKNVADAAEYIAAVVKGNCLQVRRDRHSRFQIRHHHGIATNRHGKRIQPNQFPLAISKQPLRDDDLSWPGFFETKTAQGRRAAGKETLADWQQRIEIIDVAIAIAITRGKRLSQSYRQISGKDGVPQLIELVIGVIGRQKLAEARVAAEVAGRETVIGR